MPMYFFTTITVNKHIWTTVFAHGSINKHFSPTLLDFFVFWGLFALENDMMMLQMPPNATFLKWRQYSDTSQKRPQHITFIYIKTKTDEMTAVFISCDL